MRRANASKGRPKNRGVGRKRLKQKPIRALRLPRNAPEVDLTIGFVGSRGDGIGSASYTVGSETKAWPFYVPGSLEGEQVRVKPQQLMGRGFTAELVELLSPNPSRSAPVCEVFAGLKGCGGCSLQHMNEAAYRKWKLDQLKLVFDKAGFGKANLMAPPFVLPIWTQMSGRRRVRLSYRQTTKAFFVGFTGRASHFIYPLETCGVLQTELKELITQLHDWAAPNLPAGQSGQIAINLLSSGADIMLLPDETLADKVLTALSAELDSLPVCRLCVRQPKTNIPLPLAEKAPAVLQLEKAIGGHILYPSPGSFLQASTEAETALIQAVLRSAAARIDRLQTGYPLRVMDLYCGVGTFTLPLLGNGAIVTCYDADRKAIDSLLAATRAAGLGASCITHNRDLVAAPVRAEEFCTAKGEPKFDLILLDPPRQGAVAQTVELVALADLLCEYAPDSVPNIVPDIVMVSCNPHTAVRDIAVLVAAGWQMEEVQMIDQFVRTAHTEIVTRLVFDDRQDTRR